MRIRTEKMTRTVIKYHGKDHEDDEDSNKNIRIRTTRTVIIIS